LRVILEVDDEVADGCAVTHDDVCEAAFVVGVDLIERKMGANRDRWDGVYGV